MGYLTTYSSLIGTATGTSSPTGVHDVDANLIYRGYLWNFFTSAAPAGISTFASGIGTYSYSWSATYGLQTAGDANTNFVYTVQPTDSFTGNYLIQSSFLYGGSPADNCPDPAIAVWPVANGRTSPIWNWGASATRISVQNNCASSLQIYGYTTTQTSGAFTYSAGSWYTMHFYHEPTLSRCRYAMTFGQNDWTRSGTQIATELTSTESISTAYYVGLASDADGYTLGATSCNFSGLRITPL